MATGNPIPYIKHKPSEYTVDRVKLVDGSDFVNKSGICPECGAHVSEIRNPVDCWRCKLPFDWEDDK